MTDPAGAWPVRRLFRRPVVPIVLLLAFATVALGAGVTRLAAESARPAPAGEVTRQLMHGDALHMAHDPVLVELTEVLAAEGTEAALGRLTALSATDADLRHRKQHYVHELGWLSYEHYGDVTEAFRQCPSNPDTGCYHGLMRAYFAATPRFDLDEVREFCDGGTIPAGGLPILRYNCVHGLGHGLALFFGFHMAESLGACDLLAEEWDRESCYGGVFMESIEHFTFAWERSREIAPAPVSLEENLLSLCDGLADKYRPACYLQQPRGVLFANDYDFAAGFAACDQAPAAFIVDCYQGMGGTVAIFAEENPVQAHALCGLGSSLYRVWCSYGGVRTLVGNHGRVDEALAFCTVSPSEIAAFCFESVGEAIPDTYADPTARSNACRLADKPEWVGICLSAAGLEA